MFNMKRCTVIFAGAMGMAALTAGARAEIIKGIDFPDGAVSFADAVAAFNPVIKNGDPITEALDSSQALGLPNHASGAYNYVSLGDGGSITLQFTDNSLTGSGDNGPDLWIFEIGPDVEDTFVEISKDNILWHSVGKVTGSTRSVDIDFYGFGTSDLFSFVRLTDDPNLDDQSGDTVGADIDAVGAISSSGPMPEPGTLMVVGLGALFMVRRRRTAS
jgi:hypothetical protein